MKLGSRSRECAIQGSTDLIYGLDDIPSWPRCVIYEIQWTLIFLPTLTILSTISSEHLGLYGGEKVLFFQRLLVIVANPYPQIEGRLGMDALEKALRVSL